ncbi:MAG: PBP1A family penicillin-binding protein [Myxococcales bacterium]|nr:PBP1A family penicillin-binding protein [Myxococcales bacterium]MBK7198395.1 PBP1A family penicillin-binding protein [Myxococcales bacterium]MBP6843784.1 PBP1A family penicillin-binding protein [Kofleriaceae bacterium]
MQPRPAAPAPKRPVARPPRAPRTPGQKVLRVCGWLAVVGLALAALGALVIAGVFWMYSRNLPAITKVGDYHPRQVTAILDVHGDRIGELYTDERRTVVKFDEVPPILVDAFVAAEDANFWTHAGIDYRGMVRAFFTNLRSGKTKQGASTITQQVVKTFLLTPERTFKRKIQEIILARRLDESLSKKDILTLYMNQIFFGHGRYGVQEAARFYFGKDVKDLNIGEAALLAGLPQSPNNISPLVNPQRAKVRQTYVLNELARHGKITAAEAKQWIDAPIQVVRDPFPHLGDAPEWVEVARAELAKAHGADGFDHLGGVVRTTLRPEIQEAARAGLQAALRAVDARHKIGRPVRKVKADKIADELARLGKKLPKGGPAKGEVYEAIVTAVHDGDAELEVDLGGWRAVVVLGGADDERFNPPADDGQRKQPSARFAAGDVVKVTPIAATLGKLPPKVKHGDRAVAFAPGAEGAVVVIDPKTREVLAMVGGYQRVAGGLNRAMAARRQPGSSFKPIVYAAALASKRYTPASIVNDSPEVYDLWKPENHSDGFEGPVRLRHALAKSINTVAIKVLHDIGPDAAADLAAQLGITGKLPRTLSLALGSGEVTPLELTNAYATFAAGGQYAPPRFLTETPDGPVPVAPSREVLSPAVAYTITDMMRSVVEQGTATKAKSLGLTIAGKTGTSNDARDTWFVGMTADVVIGVWIGNDDNRPLGSHEAGGVTALPAFIATVKAMAPKHQPFPRPPGVVTADIDLVTGLLAAPGAPAKTHMTEVFLDGTAPTEVAPLPGEIDATTFVTDEYGDEATPEAPPP